VTLIGLFNKFRLKEERESTGREERGNEMEDTTHDSVDSLDWSEDPLDWSEEEVTTFLRSLGTAEPYQTTTDHVL
jgi:hypothetical protein